jgi:hypothetical protein
VTLTVDPWTLGTGGHHEIENLLWLVVVNRRLITKNTYIGAVKNGTARHRGKALENRRAGRTALGKAKDVTAQPGDKIH